jgi:hypothetical protein
MSPGSCVVRTLALPHRDSKLCNAFDEVFMAEGLKVVYTSTHRELLIWGYLGQNQREGEDGSRQ